MVAVLVFWALFIGGRLVPGTDLLARLSFLAPQLVSLVCLLSVVRRFEWGDEAGRPWFILTLGPVFLLLSRMMSFWGPQGFWVEGPLILSNLMNVAGMAALLMVVRASPLIAPLEGRTRTAVWVANAVAGVATLVGLWVVVERLLDVGVADAVDWTRLAAVILLLCDAAVFALAVTLSATVLPMSGGLAARPYLLLSASGCIFLVLDLVGMLVVEGWGYGGFGPWLSYTALLAWALFSVGALAQLHVLRRAQA